MAAPTVTGAVALYKESRPNATPAEVREALRYLGNLYWKTATDPDSYHEPLLDVSRIGQLGTFDFASSMDDVQTVEAGTDTTIDVDIVRSPTFFERTYVSFTSLPDGWVAGPATSLLGWTTNRGRLPVTIPEGTPLGHYQVGIIATNQGRTRTMTVPVDVVVDTPTANAPITSVHRRGPDGRHGRQGPRRLAGRHGSVELDRRLPGPVEPGRRRVEPGRRAGGQPIRGDLHPQVRQVVPIPHPGPGCGRQLEPVGRERDADGHASRRRPQRVHHAHAVVDACLQRQRLAPDGDRFEAGRWRPDDGLHRARDRAGRTAEPAPRQRPDLHRRGLHPDRQHEVVGLAAAGRSPSPGTSLPAAGTRSRSASSAGASTRSSGSTRSSSPARPESHRGPTLRECAMVTVLTSRAGYSRGRSARR